VTLFSTLDSLIYSAWVDGTRLAMIVFFLMLFVATLGQACG
jgi:hypothetical protein